MKFKHNLSVCAVFRNEAAYLDEWLTFHSHVGIDFFYLYNDSSTDNFLEVLQPWIDAGRVQVQDSQGESQSKVYNRCISKVRFRTRWLAIIDIDEFLWSPTRRPLSELLEQFPRVACLMVRWVLFGSSGNQSQQASGILDNFHMRLPLDVPDWKSIEVSESAKRNVGRVTGMAFSGKSIVNPRRVIKFRVHLPIASFGKTADESGRAVLREDMISFQSRRLVWKRNPAQQFRINHYWSRSIDELVKKVSRSASGSFHKHEMIDIQSSLDAHLSRERNLNVVFDEEIKSIWQEAKTQRKNFLRYN